MEIIVVLHNIRSTYNVGAVLRTCEGFGVGEVILSGYTPKYDDDSLLPHLREKLNRQIAKVALGAEQIVRQRIVEDITEELRKLREQGWTVLGLENNISAREVKVLKNIPRGEKMVLLLGEEVDGIDEKLYEMVDIFAEIPMQGQKESFNVSVAAGIALYELRR